MGTQEHDEMMPIDEIKAELSEQVCNFTHCRHVNGIVTTSR